jgi:hypothetical protein
LLRIALVTLAGHEVAFYAGSYLNTTVCRLIYRLDNGTS